MTASDTTKMGSATSQPSFAAATPQAEVVDAVLKEFELADRRRLMDIVEAIAE